MNLRQFRAMHGGLENLTDREIVEFVAQSQGMTRDNTPDYDQIIENSLGYDRSLGEVVTDTLTNLGQGVMGIGRGLSSAFGAWDNPVARAFGSASDWMGENWLSQGLQNQAAGAQINSDIAQREAQARGAGTGGRLAAGAGAMLENYWNAPGLLLQDIATNAPQLVAGGVVGRGLQAGARALGAGTRAAGVTGTTGAVGTSSVLQGGDIGAQAYDEALTEIMARNDAEAGLSAPIVVTPEGSYIDPSRRPDREPTEAERAEAAERANAAAIRAGAATAATAALPFSIERSLVGRTGGLGLRAPTTRAGAIARVGGQETLTNAADEGYGQYAINEQLREINPNIDPVRGVGQASVQGAAAGGPVASITGMTTPLAPRQLPRTETGEVDLAGQPAPEPAPAQPAAPVNYDAPTWVRRGLDPLNERSSPWSPVTPPQTPRLTYEGPTAYVDPTGAVQIGQMPTEQEVTQRRYDAQAAAQGTTQGPPDDPGGGGGTPLALPYNPTTFVDPTGTAQVGTMPSEQEVTQRRYDAQAAAQTREAADNTLDIRRAVREASQALKPGYLKKDGELTKTAEAIMAPFLNAQDPVQALRDAHQNGSHPRDELLDAIHERLTGQTVFAWRQGTQPTPPADANSAGFVPEPVEQVQAQLNAARQGRKGVVVLGTEQANELDLSGLARTTATDPNTGEQAVVVSRNRAAVQRAAARAQEVGLRQAMGEAQNVVDPTLTSRATPPDEGVVAVQQVDNETGQVLADELVTPENVQNVEQIPGTTQRVVPADQPVQDRRAAAAGAVNAVNSEPTTKKPKAPKKPRYGKKTISELVEIADTTKDQAELDAAELELYKRWRRNADEATEAYFTRDIKTRDGQHPALVFADSARAKELQAMLEAEQADKLARKFNSVKARPANEVTTKPLTVQQVQTALDSIKRTTPAARGIQVMQSPADAGLEFDDGLSVAGVTFPDGRIVLFADGLTSRQDVMETVFHELFHKGVTRTPNYEQAMRDIAASDPWIRAQANQWKLTADGRRQRDGRSAAQYNALAVDEALARVAERLGAGENIGSRQTAIRGLVKWLAAKADAWGMRDLARWLRRQTYTDAERFVLDTLDQAAAPGPTTPTDMAPVRARAVDTPAGAAPAEPTILAPIGRAAKAMTSDLRAVASGREINPNLLRVLTLRQIDEQYGSKLPALRSWIGAIAERGAQAGKLAAKADRTARKWEALDRTSRDALNDIFLSATVAEVSVGRNDAEYLASLDDAQRKEHARLRQKYNALPQAAKDVHSEVRAILDEQWDTTRKALESFVEHTITDPDLRAERIKQIREEMGRSRGDYFPLSRFGDRVVIGRGASKDGRDVVSFHESAASADQEVERLRREGVKHIVVNLRTERDPRQRASTGFMGQLHAMIDQAQMDTGVKEAMHETLQQLYLKSLPEISGAKHMIRRENIEGYSKDAMRAFADAVARGARYASQLEHAPDIQAAMESAEAQSRSSDTRTASIVIGTKDGEDAVVRVVPVGLDRHKVASELMDDGYTVSWMNVEPQSARERLAARLPDLADEQLNQYVSEVEQVVGITEEGVEDLRAAKALYNYMVERTRADNAKHDTILDVATDRAGQVGFTWFLGLTPAFLAMNALQNPMVGLPHLGGKYGMVNSASEWFSAAKWFGGVRLGKLLRDRTEPFSIEWLRKQNLDGITKQELDMLQTLEDHQILDFTQSLDLSRIAESSSGKWNKAMRFAAAGAHHTEVFNRVTFALAAYRLALKSDPNMTHEQAVRRAENDVAAAHFDYSSENKPDLMRGRFSRLMFMFQQYRQHMLYWWVKQAQDAVKGESREVRLAAGKSMLLMAGMHGVFAGVMGMPFVGAVQFVADLVAGMFGDDDEDFDFERWLTDAAVGYTGSEEAGRLLTRGVLDAMGMAIGQRIGQQDLVPLLNLGSARFERNADDKMRAYLFDLWGPLGSMALGAARATEAFERGDTAEALTHVTPKFLSDLIKADTLRSEGLKNSRGQQLATAEAFDGYDVFLQATGVMPSSAAKIKEKRGRVLDMERHFNDRSRALTTAFVEAWKRRDAAGIQEALQAIQTYNGKLAKKDLAALGITGRRLETAIRDRLRRDMLLALTGGTAETRRQLLLALRASGTIQMSQDFTELPSVGILD